MTGVGKLIFLCCFLYILTGCDIAVAVSNGTAGEQESAAEEEGGEEDTDPEEDRLEEEDGDTEEDESGEAAADSYEEMPAEPEEEMEPEEDLEMEEESLIPEDTAVVFEEAELYKALNSEVVSTIYLGADIILNSDKAEEYVISPLKPYLILDGRNPYAEEETDRSLIHTLTDRDSTSEDRVMRLRNAGSLKTITVQNINIIGRNHYGIICVTSPGVTQYYENIIYSGPQLTFNPDGSAHYYNCDITIRQNGASPAGETAEAAAVVLEGNIVINKPNGGADEIFYLRTSSTTASSLKIAPGAVVDITHDQTVDGGLIYCAQVDYPIVIGSGAVLKFHGYHFVVENAVPSVFEVQEGAQVYIDLKTTGGRPGLFMKDLKIGKDAVFHMEAGGSVNPNALIVLQEGGSAVFDDPLSVLLKMSSTNADARLLRGNGARQTVEMNCGQLNYWTSSGGGGLAGLPDYHWQKREGQLTVQSPLSSLGIYTSITTNYNLEEDQLTPGWLNENSLNSTTMDGSKARIISMGKMDFTAEFTTRPNPAVKGITKPGSYVQAKPVEREGVLWGPVQASGSYEIATDYLGEYEEILVLANHEYLYRQDRVGTAHSGYELRYEGNGETQGSPPGYEQLFPPGSKVVILGSGSLEKAGYRFAGWSRDPANSDELLTEGMEILMDEDIVLYAVWVPAVIPFDFIKVDEKDSSVVLGETAFELYRCEREHMHAEQISEDSEECWVLYKQAGSNDEGMLSFGELPAGEYQLKEVRTHENYELPSGQWQITIDPDAEAAIQITGKGSPAPPGFIVRESDGVLMLPNERKIQLPLTGGGSRWMWIYPAATLTVLAAASGFMIKKERMK